MLNSTNIYPWQQTQWQYLLQANQQKHLAHALLFSGVADCGKKDFAVKIAQALLCQNKNDQYTIPCGQCKSCYVFQAKSHPDYKNIGLEDAKKDIAIAQIRELSRFLELSCSYGKMTIGIINDADRMSNEAANGLLKTLEEPPKDSLIILVSSNPARLTATTRSRCQNISFPPPNQNTALAWLKAQNLQHSAEHLLSIGMGRPLLAQQFDDESLLKQRSQCFKDIVIVLQKRKNIFDISPQWKKLDFQMLLDWQITWIQQCIIIHSSSSHSKQWDDTAPQFKQLTTQLDSQKLWQLYDGFLKLIPKANHSINQQLFVEKMLLIWLQAQA